MARDYSRWVVKKGVCEAFFATEEISRSHLAAALCDVCGPIDKTRGSADNPEEVPLQEEVIGIVRDAKSRDLERPADYVDYLPYTQRDWRFGDFEVRYTGNFGAIAREVEDAIHSVDRRLPITNVKTLNQQVANSYVDQTMVAELSGFFALVAVFLSCIGLYGLMSYLVSRRANEIGIHMALGAGRAQVGWRVMREITLLVLAGIALGLPVMLAGSRLVQKMLFGVKGSDPLSLSAAVLLLVLAGLLAGYLPARRASRIDPLTALRYE